MEEILKEMRVQRALLEELNANIAGLRADKKAASEEAVERGMKNMKDSMAQALSVLDETPLKGTPLAGMIADMMKKAGGRTPPPGA